MQKADALHVGFCGYLVFVGRLIVLDPCLCRRNGCLFRFSLVEEIAEREDERNAQNNHHDRPELRGRESCNKLTARVVSQNLVDKTENTVGNEVDTHVVAKSLFEDQVGENAKQNEQKCRLIELRGVDLHGKVRELDAKEAIGGSAVAAARKEASDASERVCNGDDAGSEGHDIHNPAGQSASEKEIDAEEEDDTADQAAEEGDATTKTEAGCGVFNIVVGRLEHSGSAEANGDRTDAVKVDEIDELIVDPKLFGIDGQAPKADENTNGDHNAVHMHVEKNRIR